MMKRITLFTFMIIVAVLFLTACGSDVGSETGDNGSETDVDMDNYPDGTVRLVVPYSAGGGTDTVGRAIAEYIDVDNESMIIANIEGSGGSIGTKEVVDESPDGQTLLIHSVTAAVSGYHTGLYDERVWKQLKPVAALVSQSGGIVVSADSEFETAEDLIEFAENNPNELSVGVPGIGGGGHIISAIFADSAGIDVNFVPFDGSADSRAALAGGHIDVMSGFVSEFYDFIQDGEFRMLASTGSERAEQLPDVPTFSELGIDFVLNHRNGIYAPADTPDEVIDYLNKRLQEVSENQEFIDLMNSLVTEVDYLNAEEFEAEMESLDSIIEPVGHLISGE
ncbi:tripartite tricarboxylate transporter substrate binding protein [Virgibacillus byunsanensis]|uniref:Tripartite tricarboxylate transporter substrate binding protein n=1 Tax=Virgibacillus byunsanensis TaxID=570945 RepID=A0ABW3LIK0_9BACI